MKINPLYDAFRLVDPVAKVQSRQDGGGNGQSPGRDPDSHKKDDEETPVVQVNSENVEAAIVAFRGDAQAKAAGLQAQAEGQGLGLRVVLKDGSGAVVRQFTGEEFLRLREAVKDGRSSGKIIDQKL